MAPHRTHHPIVDTINNRYFEMNDGDVLKVAITRSGVPMKFYHDLSATVSLLKSTKEPVSPPPSRLWTL